MTDAGAGGLPRATRLLKEVVAPTTLATGLLFYFGFSHAYWFFDYFGVNSTLLGLTTGDYLMRGVDGLFVPLIVVAIGAAAVVWGHRLLRQRVGLRGPTGGWLVAVAAVGVLLCANGLSRILVRTPLNSRLAVAPLSLTAGVALLTWTVRRLTLGEAQAGAEITGTLEYLAIYVLVGLSLFWATNDYAAAVGRARAAQFVRELPSYPETIVYSRQALNLSGVPAVRCRDPDAAYGFRYDDLALVLQSNDHYVLLPKTWSRSSGVAVVLPRTDDVRLEFLRTSAEPSLPPRC